MKTLRENAFSSLAFLAMSFGQELDTVWREGL